MTDLNALVLNLFFALMGFLFLTAIIFWIQIYRFHKKAQMLDRIYNSKEFQECWIEAGCYDDC